jgi:hypothetical protein
MSFTSGYEDNSRQKGNNKEESTKASPMSKFHVRTNKTFNMLSYVPNWGSSVIHQVEKKYSFRTLVRQNEILNWVIEWRGVEKNDH